MNVHDFHSALWPSLDRARADDLLRAEYVAVARIEPTLSARLEAFADLVFHRAGEWLFVPLVRVNGLMLVTREAPAIAWPRSLSFVNDAEISQVEERILPWLRSLTTARFFNSEQIRFYHDEARAGFEAARSAGFYGAAPYREAFQRVAPGVYAQRFARGRDVAVAGRNAGNTAAALSNVAASIGIEQDPLSAQWFASIRSTAPLNRSREYECYVGPREDAVAARFSAYEGGPRNDDREISIVQPIPMHVTVSFDCEDAPVIGTFAVAEHDVPVVASSIQAPKAVGGSSGVIRLVVRDDALRFPDADLDEARALAGQLRNEGFDAALCTARDVEISRTDLIHVFGLRHGTTLVELLRDAESAHVPVVVTPYADDRFGETILAGDGSMSIARGSVDAPVIDEYHWAFARRRIGGLASGSLYDEASGVLMKRAAAALVSCDAEADFLRERFGYRGSVIPAGVPVDCVTPSSRIGSIVGTQPYILIHAPLDAERNQHFAIHAANRTRLPLVLLGPVQNVEYYGYLTETAGPAVTLVRDGDLHAPEIEGIYARARVVADVGAAARGLSRLARGMGYGAAAVAPKPGYASAVWPELVTSVDPMDVSSIEAGFRAAWERTVDVAAFREAAATSAWPALVAAVTAYGHAAAVPVA